MDVLKPDSSSEKMQVGSGWMNRQTDRQMNIEKPGMPSCQHPDSPDMTNCDLKGCMSHKKFMNQCKRG